MLRKLRNIGIIAHVDAGKTTLTERILYLSGAIHKTGDVHDGNTTTDTSAQERARGITIGSAAVTVTWSEHQINIVDTPGHIDFNIEVNRTLRVLDGAVVVFDAVSGVEPQTETNWRLADKYRVPRLCFINKMDRIGADFYRVVNMIDEKLSVEPLVLQIPVGSEAGFSGVIDLVDMKMHCWKGTYQVMEVPEPFRADAGMWRERLLNTLAENNMTITEHVLDGKIIETSEIIEAIREGCIANELVPVLCGTAYKYKGVETLLDAIRDYLPSPDDIHIEAETPDGEAVKLLSSDTNCSALVFKEVSDKHGSTVYLRVYSGSCNVGDSLLNSRTGKMERIAAIFEIRADKGIARKRMSAGDIVAVKGLKDVNTGDSLTSRERPVCFETIAVPVPVIDIVVEAEASQEQSRMLEALRLIVKEDPSLSLSVDKFGQSLLSGMGELHLDVALQRLKDDFSVQVRRGKPLVAYREAFSKPVEVQHILKKQSGGPGQYAKLTLSFEPIDGENIEFESRIVGGKISKEFIPSIEKGLRHAAENGVLKGYPCGGFRAVLLDGDQHENDSSQFAFEIAAKEAFIKASKIAGVFLLEPIMKVEVMIPQEYMGDCIGDINRRRGNVVEQEFREGYSLIKAMVPLENMFGYIGDLRTLSAGRANYSMMFDHYEKAPKSK